MIISLYYILLLLSFLLYTFFYIKKTFTINLGFFVLYLFFLSFFEQLAYNVGLNKNINLHIYNALTFFEFNFLFLFFRGLFKGKFEKKIVFYIIIIFNIIYLGSLFYYNFYLDYNSFAYFSGCILITILLFYYFKNLLNSDKILNFKKEVSFWISLGLTIYYLGTIPNTALMSMAEDLKDMRFFMNLIQQGISTVMYSCFIFGALWSRKKYN